MTARKDPPKPRICKEPDCLATFQPTHHQQTRCSDACKIKAVKRKNATHILKIKAEKENGTYEFLPGPKTVGGGPRVFDGQIRHGEKAWQAYMVKNKFYFQAMFPRYTLAAAVAYMRKIHAFY